MRSMPARPNVLAVAASLAALLGLAGCTPAADQAPSSAPAETPIEAVRLDPAPSADTWLSDDYAHGFGASWRPPMHHDRICAIEDGIVAVSTPVVRPDGRTGSDVVGYRLADDEPVWRIERTSCSTHTAVGSLLLVEPGDRPEGDAASGTIDRVDIATGERTALLDDVGALAVVAPIAERDGIVYAVVKDEGRTLHALDGSGAPLWSVGADAVRADPGAPDLAPRACRLLDGGADADPARMPEGARIACIDDRSEGLIVVDPRTGAVTAAAGADDAVPTDAVTAVLARDGWIEIPKEVPEDAESVPSFDLDRRPLGERTVTARPTAPAGVLLTLDGLQLADDLGADVIAADGRIVAVRDENGLAQLVSGATPSLASKWWRPLGVTSSGRTLLAERDGGVSLIDEHGAELGRVELETTHGYEVMGGWFVYPEDTLGGAVIHLPRTP